MAISLEALLENEGTEVSESLYLPIAFEDDFTVKGRRYLKAGNIETDTGTYDTSKHLGAHAGSATPSTKNGTARYVRIT